MNQESTDDQNLDSSLDAQDAKFKGKERRCPKCGTIFISQFDLGQCTNCGYKFAASNPTGTLEYEERAAERFAAILDDGRKELLIDGEVSWGRLEDRLFELSSRDISSFAAIHGDETFYGFAFDCNSEYGNVLLCLNSGESLRNRAESYQSNVPQMYGNKSLKIICSDLRWSTGDWKYQGFNSTSFESLWAPYEAVILDVFMEEDLDQDELRSLTEDSFMRSVCRVLIHLEENKAFDTLKRTKDFTTFVADHDEWVTTSWDRLAMVRHEHVT